MSQVSVQTVQLQKKKHNATYVLALQDNMDLNAPCTVQHMHMHHSHNQAEKQTNQLKNVKLNLVMPLLKSLFMSIMILTAALVLKKCIKIK